MQTVDESVLLVIDAALRGLGAVILAAVVLGALRAGSWRNPLEKTGFTGDGPGIPSVIAVLAAYFAIAVFLLAAGKGLLGIGSAADTLPGARDWHLAQCIDAVAKLLTSGLTVLILSKHRAFPRQVAEPWRVLRLASIGVAGFLVVLPLSYAQLNATQIVWRLVDPGAIQPQHSVLEAIQVSEWGVWGAVHLVTAAVVVAPLTEELFFRGLLLQTAWGLTGRAWPAIAISAVLFGMIHSTQPQTVLPLATMGLVLGYIRVRYRSIGACVVTHGLFNALTMTFVLLNPDMASGSW